MTTAGQSDRPAAYEPFFGLNEPPFSLAPDPRFLFESESHSAALAQVAYALERREPLVVITGEIGTGKTLLCRTVLQRLPFKTFLSVIHDPLLESDDLVKELLKDFGVISKDPARFGGASRHELVETLHTFLSSLAPIQAHAVVMIDEAQHLRPDVLEQIRLLSNIDDENGTILQIILVGQTDLEPLLSRPELRQLRQRVSRRFALAPLNAHEVQQYIEHRLALARRGRPATAADADAQPAPHEPADSSPKPGVEFMPDAIAAVTRLSRGVPRVINLLCDRALEFAFASRERTINGAQIQAAARAVGIEPETPKEPVAPAQPVVPAEPPAIDPPAAAVPAWLQQPSPPESPALPDAKPSVIPSSEEPAPVPVFNPVAPRPGAPPYVKYLILVVLVAVLGAAVIFGLRAAQAPAADAPPPAAPVAAPRAPAAQPDKSASAPDASLSPKTAAAPAAPTASPAAGTTAPPAGSANAVSAPAFDIVVASFRTEARATSVAEEVTALGVPVHRRETDGWQQVVAGPFTSRTAAEEAQQRIHSAGLTGTQIVPRAEKPAPAP